MLVVPDADRLAPGLLSVQVSSRYVSAVGQMPSVRDLRTMLVLGH